MDYQALLYDPIYAVWGVPGQLTPGSGGAARDVRVLDKTRGIQVGNAIDVQTILPVAKIRAVELAGLGLAPDDCDGGIVTFNGKTWNVTSHQLDPCPNGEAQGQVMLILEG